MSCGNIIQALHFVFAYMCAFHFDIKRRYQLISNNVSGIINDGHRQASYKRITFSFGNDLWLPLALKLQFLKQFTSFNISS